MSTKIFFQHPVTRDKREAPVGFSWTTCLFGCIPALLRSDWKWGVILAIVGLLTYGLGCIIFAFFYNKIYIKGLHNKGYQVVHVTPEYISLNDLRHRLSIDLEEAVKA